MEFFVRREQYYWPVNELGLEPAEVTEFGRLCIENNVLSKRKIIELVSNQSVDGFTDPRLLTIRGLRRRGFTPEILKKIISHCSMERHETVIQRGLIDHHLREVLNERAPRLFAVIDPLEVMISDHTTDKFCVHPEGKNGREHITVLSNKIYIERSDFREIDEKSYYRLAPQKTIRLRYSDFFEYVSHTNEEGQVKTVTVKNIVPSQPKKIRGIIHWVSANDCLPAKFELYDDLLIDNKYNSNSKVVKNGYVEKSIVDDLYSTCQFERLGYFKFDRLENGIHVFIRVIGLVDKYNN